MADVPTAGGDHTPATSVLVEWPGAARDAVARAITELGHGPVETRTTSGAVSQDRELIDDVELTIEFTPVDDAGIEIPTETVP